jgi:hypothetical protein
MHTTPSPGATVGDHNLLLRSAGRHGWPVAEGDLQENHMIGGEWLILMPAVLALPLAAVGVILRLCEWSWDKKPGELGSRALLKNFAFVVGACLVLLAVVWLRY